MQPEQAAAILELRRRQREREKCRQDKIYFINEYCNTFDPRLPPGQRELPFKLWGKQIQYISWLDELRLKGEDGDVSKTRDAGVTWLSCAYMLHGFIFENGFTAGIGSRKLDLVDHLKDPKCIFHKVRFMLYKLPKWMQPKVTDAYCRLVNQETDATIIGEGGTEIGRGGRTSIYFVDEYDFLSDQEATEAALSANTDVVVGISTHRGIGTRFYQRVFGNVNKLFTFEWTDDPRKNKDWYEKKKAKMTASDFAREIERNPNNADPEAIIRYEWVKAAVELESYVKNKYAKEGKEIPDDLFGVTREAGLDVAGGGSDSSVYTSRCGAKLLRIEEWNESNVVITGHRAAKLAEEDNVSLLKYDEIGVGSGVGGMYKLSDSLPFETQGINGAASPSNSVFFDDDPNKSAQKRFRNKRAENWWNTRRRFEKTYHYVTGTAEYPIDELISIPDYAQLINELCIVRWKLAEAGKIQVESKDDIRKRLGASPDKADSLVYCYAEVVRYTGF